MKSSSIKKLLLFLILSTSSLLYLASLNPNRFGGYYDDSIYVTTAKSLATGQGYKVISLPHEPSQTLYPPFYPLLLSIIWKVYPHFPQNVFWMMLLSIAATVSFLMLAYRYLRDFGYLQNSQALVVVMIAGVNWRTMLLATTLLSELAYAALSLAALYLAERYEKSRSGLAVGMITGLVIGLTFLTRTSGLAVLASVGLYYALRKKWTKAMVTVGIGALFVLGWTVWCYLNRTTISGINSGYFASYLNMFRESFRSLETLNNSSAISTFLHIIGTNILLLLIASPALACFGLRYDLPQALLLFVVLLVFAIIILGLAKRLKRGPRLIELYLIAYLLLHLVPAGVAYDRYLLPIVPFLLYLIISEVATFTILVRRGLSSPSYGKRIGAGSLALAGFALTLTLLYSNASGIYESLASLTSKDRFAVDIQALDWVNENTMTSDVLVCYRDPMFYLYTGRKAVISSPLIWFNTVPYHTREPNSDEFREAFLKLLNDSAANFLILSREDFKFESGQYRLAIDRVINEQPLRFISVFDTPNGESKIYRIEDNRGQ